MMTLPRLIVPFVQRGAKPPGWQGPSLNAQRDKQPLRQRSWLLKRHFKEHLEKTELVWFVSATRSANSYYQTWIVLN